MSCLELSNRHLAVCLIPMVREGTEAVEAAARTLRAAMSHAIQCCYGASAVTETTSPSKRDVNRECDRHSPAQIIKALRCFAYQACDGDGWVTSDAYRLYNELMSRALNRLPGYEDAEWSID